MWYYAALFTNRKGNVAKPLRLALGACIIQAEYGFSDEETALQIPENPYLQYFCGYPGYERVKRVFGTEQVKAAVQADKQREQAEKVFKRTRRVFDRGGR